MQAKTLALKSCSANQRWCNVGTKTTVQLYELVCIHWRHFDLQLLRYGCTGSTTGSGIRIITESEYSCRYTQIPVTYALASTAVGEL
eukprot:COSAG05_NODE_130_length_17165_cov_154.623638_2_plen_87_part_00